MNFKALFIAVLSLSSILCISCKKEQEDITAPIISWEREKSYSIVETITQIPTNWLASDAVDSELPYLLKITYYDPTNGAENKEVFSYAFSDKVNNEIKLSRTALEGAPFGFYLLKLSVGDLSGNVSSKEHLFLYNPEGLSLSDSILEPVGYQHAQPNWELTLRDSIILKKYYLMDPDTVSRYSVLHLRNNFDQAAPVFMGTSTPDSLVTRTRLDALGYIFTNNTAGEGDIAICLFNTKGISRIYLHPAVIR
ncbi:hypothetical protein [Luteibaculum oceani]|uniref:Uncharacterized protein n=1 Tax=Luteibaculum oceani TaxID=1294296 RepID=A0A5C6VB19_9FLAO|nr:hypothetical protein [Luteibaculum oceani]TXC82074.1 hypothetical protein FRX97_02985 [Luteibaculum oceani]